MERVLAIIALVIGLICVAGFIIFLYALYKATVIVGDDNYGEMAFITAIGTVISFLGFFTLIDEDI